MKGNVRFVAIGLILAGIVVIASAANAALIIDLRATSTSGTAFVIENPKKVQYTYDGTGSVTFEAWAIVTGATGNAALEAFQSAYGSFRSLNVDGGVVFGNLTATLTPVFYNGGASGTTPGVQADLDGDGDLDIGSTVDSSSSNWMYARAAAYQNTSNASSVAPDAFQALPDGGIAIKFATLTFSLTSAVPAPPATAKTNLSWVGRVDGTTYNSAVWQEDATNKSPTTGTSIPSTGPIEIVPEPASIALVTLLGAVALVWFRRR